MKVPNKKPSNVLLVWSIVLLTALLITLRYFDDIFPFAEAIKESFSEYSYHQDLKP